MYVITILTQNVINSNVFVDVAGVTSSFSKAQDILFNAIKLEKDSYVYCGNKVEQQKVNQWKYILKVNEDEIFVEIEAKKIEEATEKENADDFNIELTEEQEQDVYAKIEVDENGYYELNDGVYHMEFRQKDNKFLLDSIRPYDLTDYSYAISKGDDLQGAWNVYDGNGSKVCVAKNMPHALAIMKKIDKKKIPHIDKT